MWKIMEWTSSCRNIEHPLEDPQNGRQNLQVRDSIEETRSIGIYNSEVTSSQEVTSLPSELEISNRNIK